MANGAQDTARLAVDAMLREYDVLRAEIALYHQQQNQSLNFAILGAPVLASAFYALHDSSLPDADLFQRALLLLFPLFVMINGISFTDRSLRVKRIAHYLHSYLRPKLIELLDNHHVWHWEFFKQASHAEAKARGDLLPLTLDWLRLAFFWLATLASWGFYVRQSVAGSTFGDTHPEQILLALNFGGFLVFLIASLGIQETTGAHSAPSLNKKIDDLSENQIKKGETK